MLLNNSEYLSMVNDIKNRIKAAQYKAMLSANEELIQLYWDIGNDLLRNDTWGSGFLESLAKDIKIAMPHLKGYSKRNLQYMKKFAKESTDIQFFQTVSAKLPWSHNIILLDKLDTMELRYWYGYKSIENAWSVAILEHQIATRLYDRQEKTTKLQNFDLILPKPQSELAVQTMKDPYIFDFLEYNEDMLEPQLEKQLVKSITNLLLEMGTGFAFLGNQYHLNVGGEDFYLDMLFYNLKLKCYVVVDLKTVKFTPEHAGKMNFYLSVVDDQLKSEADNLSIGLILCRNENKMVAEYALKDMSKPIGVSEYKFVQELPELFKDALPKTSEITNRIKI